MQTQTPPSPSKIGSVLAAFERNISRNEQCGSAESKNFLTGIAYSPKKVRVGTPANRNRKTLSFDSSSKNGSVPAPPPLTNSDNLGTKNPRHSNASHFRSKANNAIPFEPRSPTKSVEAKSKDRTSSPTNSSCSTTSVESTSSIESAEDMISSVRKTSGNVLSVDQTSATGCKAIEAELYEYGDAAPTPRQRQSTVRGNTGNAPASSVHTRQSSIEISDRDQIKLDLLMESTCANLPPTPTISPMRRARQRAIRQSIAEGLKQIEAVMDAPSPPSRKSSDPSILSTDSYEQRRGESKVKNDRRSSKRRTRKATSRRIGVVQTESQKERLQRLIAEAQKYNAADHGLKGLLKWTKKRPKNLNVRFIDQIGRSRRASIDMPGASEKDYTPIQPRRRSLSDVNNCQQYPPPFLKKANKKRKATTLLRAAFVSSLMLKRIQVHKARAATKIQKVVRTFLQKPRYQIMLLEHKLQKIEQQRQNDLKALQDEKWRRMAEIRDNLESKFHKEEELAVKAQELVEHLKKENSKIQEQNAKLNTLSQQLVVSNEQCRASTKILFENFGTMDDAIKVLNDRNIKVVRSAKKYEARISQAQLELDDVNMRLKFESKTQNKMEETITKIRDVVKSRRGEAKLLHEIGKARDRLQDKVDQARDPDSNFQSRFELSFRLRDGDEMSVFTDSTSLFDPDESVFILRTFQKLGLSFQEEGNSYGNFSFDDDEKTYLSMISMDTFASGLSL